MPEMQSFEDIYPSYTPTVRDEPTPPLNKKFKARLKKLLNHKLIRWARPFLVLTSAGRTRAQNEKVGGAQYSAHQWGLAVDLSWASFAEVYDRETWQEFANYAAILAPKAKLSVIPYATHIHIQPADWTTFAPEVAATQPVFFFR